MYEEHRVFKTPYDDCEIWKYMSFTKFVWLIAKKALYFSRLDQHDDSWEGFLPTNWDIKDLKYSRFNAYINCWHMNSDESDAMWKLYGNPADETIAIKTTVGRLKESMKKSAISVYIGEVDYEEKEWPESNLYFPVICKRKPFVHEKELRLCVPSPSGDNPPDLPQCKQELDRLGVDNWSDSGLLKEIGEKGVSVSVDLSQLIDEVIISPKGKDLLRESLQYIKEIKIPHIEIKNSII
ncbi:MAG: hypothetical protein COB30_000475 [Ectothiorhodospiraceae bacterium]|nr:hypothetical protein [Ectothiorhodospiraceae bacterium]